MKKFLLTMFLILAVVLNVQAKPTKRDFNSIISDSNINRSSVAVTIKDFDSGKTVYSLNEKTMMHPASVQKILTILPAIDSLGENYEFKTSLYSRGADKYIIKLGADPYLRTNDIEHLVKNIDKLKIKNILIDDSIIEKKDWGEGWQWDDELNTCMPKFNSYNLDGNILNYTVMPETRGKASFIINQNKYPTIFHNNVTTGTNNSIKVSRDNEISANSITLTGIINTPTVIKIPTDNLSRYFNVKLTQSLESREIYLKNPSTQTIINTQDKKLSEISHPVSAAIDDILKNSNNTVSETLLKLAAHKAYKTTGTDELGIKLFDEYCKKIGIDNSEIRLVDASGVSKNNLVNTDFVAEYLYKNKNNKVYNYMVTPDEGTLTGRLLPLKGNLRAKTGTLSDVSSIAGFVTTKKGKQYVFCIMINDPKSTNSEKKMLEDYLIREIYLKG